MEKNSDQTISILAYFRQIYGGRVEVSAAGETQVVTLTDQPLEVEYLHLAWSKDGRHWTPLNNNRPVVPEVWLRDPFVNRGPDGWFHLLGTGGNGPRNCLYMRSHDLVHWEAPRSLPLMQSVPEANNIWAPEWFFDETTGEYLLLWSSSFEDAGWKSSRLWCCRTKDFLTFTAPKVFFEPHYSVIDGTLLLHEGTYYLFHKEEEFGAIQGERRAIRLATATASPEGPYTIYEGPLNNGQIVPVITEGPSVMPDPQGKGWLLLYDFCMSNDYGISHSSDLWHWKEETDISFPANARHGSVLSLTAQEFADLQDSVSKLGTS